MHSQAQIVITTIAGNGTPAYSGDMGPATSASIDNPYGVAADTFGNVYFTDYNNNRIRKIDTFGVITTIAGTGIAGFSGDGASATLAKIDRPRGIAVDQAGNVFFSDYANLRIRKISTSGIITTIAGNGFATFSGDGGPASAAGLNYAWGIAVDRAGNIYLADQTNCRIRKINTSGIISTIAGTGICFIGGDGGPAVSALVQYPLGLACDTSGNLYIADNGNNRIRKINSSGVISTIAGSPTYGFTGDGGPSTAARLYYPMGIASDAAGNVYICDVNNSRIRKINTAGIINTIAGTGVDGYSGDGGLPTFAMINRPTGIALGPKGKIYFSDNNNNRIRMINIPTHAPYFIHGDVKDTVSCPTESIGLDSFLAVFDVDTNQTETWGLISGPYHGVVAGSYTTLSTGSTFYPLGLSYAAAAGYSGTDSFKIRISDGALDDTITIHVTTLPAPSAGTISGIDSLCPGDTLTFTDTASGGTWASGNTSLATVSASGLVTGIAPGATFITYTVTNLCGTATATLPFTVRSGCPVSIHNMATTHSGMIHVSPNPGNGHFTISLSLPDQEDVRFTITNMLGETINEFTSVANKSTELNLSAPAGIYMISANTGNGRWVSKLIIGQ